MNNVDAIIKNISKIYDEIIYNIANLYYAIMDTIIDLCVSFYFYFFIEVKNFDYQQAFQIKMGLGEMSYSDVIIFCKNNLSWQLMSAARYCLYDINKAKIKNKKKVSIKKTIKSVIDNKIITDEKKIKIINKIVYKII